MRFAVLIVAIAFLLFDWGGERRNLKRPFVMAAAQTEYLPTPTISTSSETTSVDFESQVKPIFQAKCMPCHFSGGQMYERLPFDRPGTIRKLGVKLFTRIKDEGDRRIIREFLEDSE